MSQPPQSLRQSLQATGQDHVLAGWEQLAPPEQAALVEQLQAIDLPLLQKLFTERDHPVAIVSPSDIEPIEVLPCPGPRDDEARARGKDALRRGEVGILVVAGGQGSRLGFEHPKGLFPVGSVSRKTLLQIHAEKVLALRRRYAAPLPLLVMTSPATNDETIDFFKKNHFFGLPADTVIFFQQGSMPALDMASGKLLLEAPGKLFLSPDGHGGTLTALARTGLLERLRDLGIRHLFYFQVDNPLVKVADPIFLGHHLLARSEVSSKVIRKETPTEKLGNFVQVHGRCTMIEYSDLPENLARQTKPDGNLLIAAGNPAIHIFALDFLATVTRGATAIPFHVARKKVPYLNDQGVAVQPTKENALKFERFIFDVLPRAERWVLVETSRREEFEPLKNATGPDSPESVARAMTNLAAQWLETAGVKVPRDAKGQVAFPLEISPLYALDAQELAGKVNSTMQIDGPTYLG